MDKLYHLLVFWKKTFMQSLEQTHGQVHTKMQQSCSKNKFTLGETKL